MNITSIKTQLETSGYVASKEIAFCVSAAVEYDTPLILEGKPGCGKTSLAKAVANMLQIPLIRVQFYEGLTSDQIMYDYDYQRQLLSIEAMKFSLEEQLKGKDINEALQSVSKIDFYGKDFLIKRPLLQAITGESRCVLLLDELDKASEELEYTLLELLDEFSMTIPQYGTVRCPEDRRPIVIITSNSYRELSDALKRRCNYYYIPDKTKEEIKNIVMMHAGVDERLALGVASCIYELSCMNLKQQPSVSEAITWASCLKDMEPDEYIYSISVIIKNLKDQEAVSYESMIAKLQGILQTGA